MNMPIPDHFRKALETVSLDESAPRALSRRHKYFEGGAAGFTGFGGQRAAMGEAA